MDLQKLKREAVFPIPVPGAGLFVVRGIPMMEIEVQDRNLYIFLRLLEQGLGGPPRETVALAASLFNYGLFIAREMRERNKAQVLAGRTLEFTVGAFAFFVVHAMAAALKKNPHPASQMASFVLLALAYTAGAILGVDFTLANMEKLELAGRHFSQMERLHRGSASSGPGSPPGGPAGKNPVEVPPLEEAKLTKLSEDHLKAGSEALLDAMADYFALGVVLVGGLGVAKLRRMSAAAKEAKAIREHIRDLEADAQSKLKVDDEGAVEEVEPLKPAKRFERVPAPKPGKPGKPAGGLGAEKPAADGKPKPEKKKPQYGEYFHKRCDALKKRVEALKEQLDSVETPSDAGRAQRLEELTMKAAFLLESIELARRSKGERLMPVLSKEVAEYEAEVAKEPPRPMPEEPPRESEGLYVIQEHGELQGEPQRGKVPELRGRAHGPDPSDWRRNSLGPRTVAEAIALLRYHNIEVDPDVKLVAWADKFFQPGTYAEYGGLDMRGRGMSDQIGWEDLLNKRDGTLIVRVRNSVFESDEAILSVCAHEMHEINSLKKLFDDSTTGTLSVGAYYRLIRSDLGTRDRNLHTEAWDAANALLRKVRSQESEGSK